MTSPLHRWKVAAVVALAVIVVTIPLGLLREPTRRAHGTDVARLDPGFVGRQRCLPCHEAATRAWTGSDHDLAMDKATEETVLGNFDDAEIEHHGMTSRFFRKDGRFFVNTEGPSGALEDFEITHVFGHDPLQQYLIPFPGGRLQCLTIAWDNDDKRWFHLYPDQDIPPDDWLHWTRNAQNWNGMCAECHSTNLRKSYDAERNVYATEWSEIDVSCEACHGPGSRHLAWAEMPPMARPEVENYGLVIPTSGTTSRQQVELCAPCHSRRSELGDYDHTRVPLLDNQLSALLGEGLYHADGQILEEVYVWGSFVQSKMYHNDVRCSDCHDSHSLKLHFEGNALCLQCHRADAYDVVEHHFHKKIHEGKPSDGALCVKCHMQESTYMIIDERADHSFRVPRPDLSLAIGTPNACSQVGCHDDKTLEWAATEYEKWYGRARKPHYGTLIAAGRRGDPEARTPLLELAENRLYPTIVRATALSLLGRYPGPETTAVLKRALMDEEPLLRRTAADSVLATSADETSDLLAPLLLDPIRAVRLQAVSRLAGIPAEHLESYQREALERGVAEYRSALEYSLDFASAAMNLGNLANQMGDFRNAERYFRKAIEIDELFFPAKMNLAVLLDGQGRTEEATRLLREVMGAYPDNYEAAYSLGLGLAATQQYEEAASYLERATKGMPENGRAHYNYGLLLQQMGRDRAAEAALGRALEVEPTNFDFLFALADFYAKRSRYREAEKIADRIIQAHPDQRVGPELKAWLRDR